MAIKAIVFVRVSSNAQDLVPQRIEVLDYAKRFYAEDEIAIVEGKESAIKLSEERRKTLKEMKEIIAEYPSVEQIFCFALDRISRRCEVRLSDGLYELRVMPRTDLIGKYDPANYTCRYYSRGGYLNLYWGGVNCRESIPIRMKSKYRGRKKVRVDN